MCYLLRSRMVQHIGTFMMGEWGLRAFRGLVVLSEKRGQAAKEKAMGKLADSIPTVKPYVAKKVSQEELAELGGGKIAYMRQMTAAEAREEYPDIADEIPEDVPIYTLHAANGKPMGITDELSSLSLHATQEELEVMRVS